MLFWKLAFRNIFRNPRRSGLTLFIMGMGLVALMVADGMILGMTRSMIQTSTGVFLGHAQIHHKDFPDDQDIEDVIPRVDAVLQQIAGDPGIAAYAPRVLSYAMVASARDVGSAMVYGIDLQQEPKVSKIAQALVKGEFLDGHRRSILLGSGLAESLQAEIGDRIVVTVSEAHSGELAQQLFRLSGIVHFNTREMDQGTAFIALHQAQSLTGVGENVHEIALRFERVELASYKQGSFWTGMADHPALVQNWGEIMPSLRSMLEMSGYSVVIVVVILYALVSLTIINTLFMSIYERSYEFGVLRAIGTRARRLSSMILAECLLLGGMSACVGLVIGYGVNTYFSLHGVSMGNSEIAGVSLHEPIRSVHQIHQYTVLPLSLVVLSVIAGLYPAWHVSKIVPTEAMRKSL